MGELALNTYDGKIFFRRSGSTDTIQEVIVTNSTNTGSINLIGNQTITGSLNITGSNITSHSIAGNILFTPSSSFEIQQRNAGGVGVTLSINNGYGEADKSLKFRYNTTDIAEVTAFGRTSTAYLPYLKFKVYEPYSSTYNEAMRITNFGNTIIQTGGTFTDNGYKLQISGSSTGSLYVTGSSLFNGSVSVTGSIIQSGSLTSIGPSTFIGNITQTGSLSVSGDITVLGAVNARQFNIGIISSSVIYQSGSTKFGDTGDDIMQITGSVQISGSQTITGSVNITGSIYVNGNAVGIAPGPNTYDFNLSPQAAGTVNFIQDNTGNTFVIANTGSIEHTIGGINYLSISASAMNVTTGSKTANYMHLAKYINTAGDLDFNI